MIARRVIASVLVSALVVLGSASIVGAQADPADELLLLRTTGGDILIELLDDAAPQTVAQIRAVTRAGGFDGLPFVRIVDDWIVQAGQVEAHRRPPATDAQLALITNLPLETSPEYLHTRGAVSLARFDAPESGTTSFSILMGDWPHMDGEYAVFGRVVDGMEVVELLNQIPTDSAETPLQSVEIWQAQVGPEAVLRAIDGLATTPSASTSDWFAAVPGIATGSTLTAATGDTTRTTSPGTTAGLLGAALFGIAAFLFAGRIEPRLVGALGLLAALAAGFGLLVIVVPSDNQWTAVLFFVALVGFFRLLSRFEAVSAPSATPQPTQPTQQGVDASDMRPPDPASGTESAVN